MAETLSFNGNGHSEIKLETTVDLPTPDGPEMIIKLPDGVISSRAIQVGELLSILNHLADPLDDRLHFNNVVGDLSVIRFRANRVRFS